VAVCFKFAKDRTSRGSSDIGHMSEVFVIDIDFDWDVASRAEETAISNTEQNRHEALEVVAHHQVIGTANGKVEIVNRYECKQPPS
jgi:hypothetical protein